MSKQQRQAFEEYERSLNFFDEEEFERIGEDYVGYNLQPDWKLWQAALAQREPVAEVEVVELVSLFQLHHKHEILDWDIYLMGAALLERVEAARLAAEQESKEAHAEMEEQCRLAGELSAECEVLRADHARLSNDLVSALAECRTKQETILALQSHDDKEQRHQAYLTLRAHDEKEQRT